MKNNLFLEEEYHDSVAKKYALVRNKDFIWEIPEEIFLIRKKFFSKKNVIDMGCGPAISIQKIFKNKKIIDCHYIGVDISSKMIKIGKKNIKKGIFIQSDISNVKLEKCIADTIVSLGALHHVESRYKTIHHWYSLLKKNGYLLLREPTIESLKKGDGASPTEEGIDVEKLEMAFQKNGLVVLNKYFFGSFFFHLMNRLFRKLFGSIWTDNKLFWYPLMIFDVYFSTYLQNIFPFAKGDTVMIIAQKV